MAVPGSRWHALQSLVRWWKRSVHPASARPPRPVTPAEAQAFLDTGLHALTLQRERHAWMERLLQEFLRERRLKRFAAFPGLRPSLRADVLKSVVQSQEKAARETNARMKTLKNPPLHGPN